MARRPIRPRSRRLETDIAPEKLTRIEITPPGGDSFVFTKNGKNWSQPGNWPLRAAEVNELVEALGTLNTRFQPIPLPEDANPADYGLVDAQKPVVVKVKCKSGNEERTHVAVR